MIFDSFGGLKHIVVMRGGSPGDQRFLPNPAGQAAPRAELKPCTLGFRVYRV